MSYNKIKRKIRIRIFYCQFWANKGQTRIDQHGKLMFLFFFIYVIYVTNHQNHCKCKIQMFVILGSHGLLDWLNKTILFYTISETWMSGIKNIKHIFVEFNKKIIKLID